MSLFAYFCRYLCRCWFVYVLVDFCRAFLIAGRRLQAIILEMEHRRRKTFFPHIDPIVRFSDHKFMERYRLPKEVVYGLARDYVNLGFCSTSLGTRGGGLSGTERVSKEKNLENAG